MIINPTCFFCNEWGSGVGKYYKNYFIVRLIINNDHPRPDLSLLYFYWTLPQSFITLLVYHIGCLWQLLYLIHHRIFCGYYSMRTYTLVSYWWLRVLFHLHLTFPYPIEFLPVFFHWWIYLRTNFLSHIFFLCLCARLDLFYDLLEPVHISKTPKVPI